jgi:hypothetical protein
MNNKQALEKFDGYLHGAFIDKLFWIAASWESSELKELMEELSERDWLKAMPELKECEYLTEAYEKRQMFEVIVNFQKFGFLAEIHYPICHGFSFGENGKPTSWSSNNGRCRIGYVYAETREELITKIQADADELFQEFINDDRKKKLHKAE